MPKDQKAAQTKERLRIRGKDAAARYRKRNPEKAKARTTLGNAVRSGILERFPCEVCGEKKTQGHHEDYTKPLDVRWLCRKCHAAHHRAVGFF